MRGGTWKRIAAALVLTAVCATGMAPSASAASSSSARQEARAERPPRGHKLSPRLRDVAAAPSGRSRKAESAALSLPSKGPGRLLRRADGRLTVQIRTADTSSASVSRLEQLGAQIVHVSPEHSTVTAYATPDELRALATDPDVSYVMEVLAPLIGKLAPTGSTGTVSAAAVCSPLVSEADTLMNAEVARAANEVDGTGQTVGILSDSFNKASAFPKQAEDVASGDLPGPTNPCGRQTPVRVLSDYPGVASDEGRAMAQLVHDLAPGANLSFATAFTGDLAFASNIRSLSQEGASVVVDDVTYFNEPFFQNGPIAQAANDVHDLGVSYFSSAGNSNVIVDGQNVSSYEASSFRPTSCPAGVLANEPLLSCHDFDTGGAADNGAAYTLAPGGRIRLDLQWAQPWYGVATDLDVFVLNASGNVVANSLIDNTASDQPFEFVSYTNNTGTTQMVRVVIGKFSGAPNPRLKYVALGSSGITDAEYAVSAGGDEVGPTIFGHNGAAGVSSTAAIPFDDSSTTESFSSRGPVTLYFEDAGSQNPLASPLVLDKPDFGATDGTRTTFFGQNVAGTFRFYGTSAAAPHAAAVAALLRNKNPLLTSAEVRDAMRSTAQPVPTNGGPADVGAGYVDALAALATTGALPSAPRDVKATPGNAEATVAWSPPLTSPMSPAIEYTVVPSIGSVPQPALSVTTSSTSTVVPDLENGTEYAFVVTPNNENGSGVPSAPSDSITVGTPTAPRAAVAVPGNGRATVSWTAPVTDNGSPITGYVITVHDVAEPVQVDGGATSHVITGLTNGQTYSFQVTAVNAFGSSAPSDWTSARVGAPLAPSGVTPAPANEGASVSWTPPANNGSAVTGYYVHVYRGSDAEPIDGVASATPSLSIDNLTNGTSYRFTVQAQNARGFGAPSSFSPFVVAGSPSRPTGVTAISKNGAATLTWASSANNGAAISGYVVTPYKAGVAQPARVFNSTAKTQNVGGLVNGASYTFKVAAKNARGTGPQSTASAAVVVGTPGAPTQVSATAGPTRATVRWTAPPNNGSTITSYVITPYIAGVAQPARTFPATATIRTLTALTRGKLYTFKVAAVNGRGTGVKSAASNAVRPT
jgi:hypothetical protein